jgi:hypothetical protein
VGINLGPNPLRAFTTTPIHMASPDLLEVVPDPHLLGLSSRDQRVLLSLLLGLLKGVVVGAAGGVQSTLQTQWKIKLRR